MAWIRNRMSEERYNGLMLLYMNGGIATSYSEVIYTNTPNDGIEFHRPCVSLPKKTVGVEQQKCKEI